MNDVITYLCHGFNDDLPEGKASGKLAIYGTTIECTIAGRHYRIPLEGLHIKIGGASDRLVFLTHPSLPGWNFYTSDRSILNNAFLRRQKPLRQHLRKAHSVRLFNWMVLAAVLFIVVVLPLTFFININNISKIIAKKIPFEWERQLGKTAYAQFITSTQRMDIKGSADLLQPMTVHLQQALTNHPYEFTFTIINDAELNAFALPGGYIVIHSGLILNAESAGELLGVLAHEIAHVVEQHGMRNMITSAGALTIVAALFGDVNGFAGTIATAAPLLINQSYSRDFEREADRIGYQLLVDADIDPQGLTRFFEKMLVEEKRTFADDIDNENALGAVTNSLVFLRSHPTTEERIKRLRHIPFNRQENFRDLSAEFDQLQLAVKQFVISNTEEKYNGSRN